MVDAREVRSEVLAHFWTLASDDGARRMAACEALMGDLRARGGGGDEDDGETVNDGDGADVRAYALRRLTRGLSSGRAGARRGFALALSELASEETRGTTPAAALRAMDENEPAITKSTKGDEVRDILLGRLFGAVAIAMALGERKDLEREERARVGAEIARRARALAKEKVYLAEPAALCVLELKKSIGDDLFVAVAKEASEDLSEWLNGDGAESLWLACELHDVLPAKMRENVAWFPGSKSKGKLNWSDVCTRAHLGKISNALLEAAHAHPRMHEAWSMMLREAPAAGGTVALWEVVCEEGLFATGSHQRRFLGFRVFDALLASATAQEIPALFSTNFIKCLLNNLNAPDNYLHECAIDCLARIVTYASDKNNASDKKIAVIAALQREGPTRFDRVTKTNAVQELVNSLDNKDAVHYLESMYAIVTTAPEQDPDVVGTEEELASALASGTGQKRRLWALEQMTGLIPMLPNDKVLELMQFMLFHAYYKTSDKTKKGKSSVPKMILESPLEEPVGSVRVACATRFLAMINANIRAQRAATNKDADTTGDTIDLLSSATSFCRSLETEQRVVMCDAIPKDCMEVRNELFKALDLCEESDDELAKKVMPLICVLSVLQVSDWREFTPAMQDLPRCVTELVSPKKKSKSKKKDEEEPEAIDVLTDILLSLLAQPSALLRDVVEHTFKAISGKVSKAGVEDMLRIIAGPEAGMDDAAMFRIDKLLAEAFKSRQQDLMRKKNLKRATRDFKFRVISLFEIYAKTQPGSAYLPSAIVTLLDAMRESLGKQDPQSTQLAERISSLIVKHISHARDLPEGDDEDVAAAAIESKLKSVIVSANRGATDAQVFNKASGAAASYLLRVLEAVSQREKGGKAPEPGHEVASDHAIECYRDALKMFKSKKSRLKTGFFSQTFTRHPALAAALLPELFGLAALDADKPSARGEFLRLEALKLINPVIQSGKKRYPGLAKMVAKSMKMISTSLASAIGATYKNKNTRADACQQIVICIESIDRLLGDASITSVINVDGIVAAVAEQMAHPPAMPQKAQKAFARLCALLSCSVPDVEMRETADVEDASASEDEAPPKKEKKSKKRASTDDGDEKSSKSKKKKRSEMK
ncbi:DNA polymerase phi-domain-containing protein [Ostreococcus tauri]|uniref:DNA polymerase phi-domain-containing protein n=1 Tax=Ostreococcus tauri TaxID=70448 RepID=A0A1Y5IJ47_OSTTA|nr:DNA polymerase phi-domain-containing protein [Ostreococcus tauri]